MPDVLQAAAEAVAAVEAGASLNDALPQALAARHELSLGERAAVQEATYGTLRWGVRLEAMLSELLTRPDTAPALRAFLRVALYRLFYGRLPDYAAVNLAVEAGPPSRKGFVNAILRSALRRRAELEALADADPSTRLSYPQWWIDAAQAAWGDVGLQALAAGNLHPPFTLRVNRRRMSAADYLAWLDDAGIEALGLGGEAVRLPTPLPVDRLPGFADGVVSVQDLAAQWTPDLLDLRDGQRVLDACAAPGGKTAHILERADVDLLALDSDAKRLHRVGDTLQRLGLQARLQAADAAEPDTWWDGRRFDRVLADLPCSGSGVVRRHPDIKMLRRPADIGGFVRQQQRILDALWPLVELGGRLLMVTCSMFPQENRQQAQAFAARHPDAVPLALDHPALTDGQALPDADHDGFFFAAFQKGH